ncbi:hypothetical protein quinque_014742 [Culex quinquefasciatus]
MRVCFSRKSACAFPLRVLGVGTKESTSTRNVLGKRENVKFFGWKRLAERGVRGTSGTVAAERSWEMSGFA